MVGRSICNYVRRADEVVESGRGGGSLQSLEIVRTMLLNRLDTESSRLG